MAAKPRGSLFHWFGQGGGGKYSMSSLSQLCSQLSKTSLVTERNRDAVVEQLRLLTELLVWGDRHEPAFFEFFLEKRVLSTFWRILAQQRSPVAVKVPSPHSPHSPHTLPLHPSAPLPPRTQVQLLQTLAMLLGNIAAGPSVFFILSNNHINELITHPFDLSHEELLTHYVSLLKVTLLS